MERTAHPTRAAPLLRLPALPVRHGPGGRTGATRPPLDRHDDALHPRPAHVCGGRLDRRARSRRAQAGGAAGMKWNLRLAAAQRGIWKASELQRMLAERGLKISAGKMSGLWSGQPVSVKLSDLN